MKTTITLLALTALAQATPVPSSDNEARSLLNLIGIGKETDAFPFHFTSTYSVIARPDQVVDSTNKFTGGLEGATGLFNFGINSDENVICYNITLDGFRGEYQSLASTATHIHESTVGKSGPPRLAFPNPMGEHEGRRNSVGCLKGPFKTGLLADGVDTGDGFHVKEIEDDPSAFNADVHSSEAVPGAVRGQLDGTTCK